MSFLLQLFDFVLHLDKYLQLVVNTYSTMTYGLLFLIIFLETGVVVAPFLPGDSLLFTAGALAGIGSLKIEILFPVFFIAAVAGDTLNYHIGKYIGPKIFKRESSIFFNKKYLLRAQSFYEKNGKKTIILARFIPIMRTFAPFVAGIGNMSYGVFFFYNVLGGLIWTTLFLMGGYLFGNTVWIKEHFGVLVLAIIFISLIPFMKEAIVHFLGRKKV